MQKVIDRWGDGTEPGTLDAYEKLALRYAGKVATKLIEALDVLERIEWCGSDVFEETWCECPICGAPKRKRQHKPGCEIGALLHGGKGNADNA